MSHYFHDTSKENTYHEDLEEQELQDYAWEMVNHKIKKEVEEKAAAVEKEKAEALEKERKELEKWNWKLNIRNIILFMMKFLE